MQRLAANAEAPEIIQYYAFIFNLIRALAATAVVMIATAKLLAMQQVDIGKLHIDSWQIAVVIAIEAGLCVVGNRQHLRRLTTGR